MGDIGLIRSVVTLVGVCFLAPAFAQAGPVLLTHDDLPRSHFEMGRPSGVSVTGTYLEHSVHNITLSMSIGLAVEELESQEFNCGTRGAGPIVYHHTYPIPAYHSADCRKSSSEDERRINLYGIWSSTDEDVVVDKIAFVVRQNELIGSNLSDQLKERFGDPVNILFDERLNRVFPSSGYKWSPRDNVIHWFDDKSNEFPGQHNFQVAFEWSGTMQSHFNRTLGDLVSQCQEQILEEVSLELECVQELSNVAVQTYDIYTPSIFAAFHDREYEILLASPADVIKRTHIDRMYFNILQAYNLRSAQIEQEAERQREIERSNERVVDW